MTTQGVLETDIVKTSEVPTDCRPQSDYKEFRKVADVTLLEGKADTYELRPYQEELVPHANNGRNTIICAPTGSGKTLVATDVILKHLRDMRKKGVTARVAFIVPTVLLVEQQAIELLKYMFGEFWVDGFSGGKSPFNRAGSLLASDVVVATPQILINMLNSFLRREKIYFSDFTMLIFDECHHCTADHPYRVLMRMLKESPIQKKPQVIGMTASLGVGRSSTLEQCREHMLRMCSDMMADSISTVRKHVENLKAHVMPSVDVIESCRRPPDDAFAKAIKKAMLIIQAKMEGTLLELFGSGELPLTQTDITFPSHSNSARYQTMVGSLRKHVERLKDSERRLPLLLSIDHLWNYFHAVAISDLLPNKYALAYLQEKMNTETHGANDYLLELNSELLRALEPLAMKEKEAGEKEILLKLYKILTDQYSGKPESRTLIFVATRACAKQLSVHLSKYLSTIESLPCFYNQENNIAGYLTSSNQSSVAGGQSNELQRQMRNRFEKGELKILVVTSVADEGINIMACNLIIKYNSVGSEHTLIQRRGRARAPDSKSILLALDGCVGNQELDNMYKERLMFVCMKYLQDEKDEALQKMIADKTKEIDQALEANRQKEKLKREMLNGRRYRLLCRACNKRICDSMNIRSIADSHYICVDKEIWQRSKNVDGMQPSTDGVSTKCAKRGCAECGEEWGVVLKFVGAYFLSLNAKSFILQRLDAQEPPSAPSKKRAWKQIREEYFNIDPITSQNILDMFHSLKLASQTDYALMEQQEALATAQATKKMAESRQNRQQVILDDE